MAQRTERSRFRIGDLLVHPDRKIVIRDGEEIHLETRWMQVLVYLAEHHKTTVGTLELMHAVWGSTEFEEGAVHSTISKLRSKVLRDDPRAPRYIQTISGQGYRLIAPVAWPDDYLSGRSGGSNWRRGNPYVGLAAFDEAHADVFFGRGDAVARVMTAMRAQFEIGQRFVLLVGASGSGKTSLLNAGVIPRLTPNGGENGLRALSVARCDLGAAADGDALGALAVAIAGWTLGDRPVLPPQPVASLKDVLVGSRECIHAAIDEAFRRQPVRLDTEPHAHLLLVLDHSEALVATSDRDAPAEQQAATKQALARFVQALETLCDHPRVLATMIVRGDFYPKLMEAVPSLIERKGGFGHVDVARPTAIEINEIITLPAIAAGLEFERDPDTRAVHHLNDTLAEAARGQADVLPLLQHTLNELYKRCADGKVLTYAAYREIGELEGAIAQRAEEVFASLPQEAQASLDAVLGQLVVVDPDSGAISGRRARWSVLPEAARSLAQAFVNARLFSRDSDGNQLSYGVAHEALLRQWPRASEWARENRRLLLARDRLQDAKRRWLSSGKRRDFALNEEAPLMEARQAAEAFPESIDSETAEFLDASKQAFDRRRRLKLLAIAILLELTIASITLSMVAIKERNDSNSQRNRAQGMIGFMLVDLYQAADIMGDLDLPERMSRKVISDCALTDGMPTDAREAVNCSRAVRILGRVMYAKGMPDSATDLFSEAALIAKTSHELDPSSEDAINEMGQSAFWNGQIAYDKGRLREARRYWMAYLSRATRLLAMDPYNPTWMIEVSYAANNLGIIAKRQGNPDDAIRLFRASVAAKESAITLSPDNDAFEKEKIDTLSWISSTLEDEGRLEEASQGYAAQILDLRKLISSHPLADDWKLRLANYLQLDAKLQIDRADLKRAQESARESILILEDLTERKGNRWEWKIDLAQGHTILSDAYRSGGKQSAALDEIRMAETILSSMPERMHGDLSWRRLEFLTRFMRSRYERDEAGARQAMTQMLSLREKNPGDEIGLDCARMLTIQAESEERSGNLAAARNSLRESLRILEGIKKKKSRSWARTYSNATNAMRRIE